MGKSFVLRLSFLFIAFLAVIVMCVGCREEEEGPNVEDGKDPASSSPITYNIYMENSGSMAGYCNIQNEKAIETLLSDYYDRLSSNEEDTVTLNFINTNVTRFNGTKIDYLKSIKKKCNAQYTKIDSMLYMMMDKITGEDVNILVTDCVFTTDCGNFEMASSAIESLFSKHLKTKDMAVAIFKYMCDFNGNYYPGGIACHKPLPLYIWVFGERKNVKKVVNMPFNTQNCGAYYLHIPVRAEFVLLSKDHRIIKNNKIILVSNWKKQRRCDYYEFKIRTDLSGVLLSQEDIIEKSNYKLKCTGTTQYEISHIESINDSIQFTIRTKQGSNPAPGVLTLSYPMKTPDWVEKSNFTGTGIPSDSTTCGISYLINGVSKAFNNYAENKKKELYYFEININLE